MCDFSGKLIAWMDGELPDSEAMDVERHLEACAECRSSLSAHEQVSNLFAAYCAEASRAAAAARPQRGMPRWAFAAAGAAAAAALFVMLIPRRVMQSPAQGEGHPAAHASAGRSMGPAALAATSASSAVGVHSSAARPTEPTARNPSHAHRIDRDHILGASAVEHPTERMPIDAAASLPSYPAIEIAIPSEAIFPAGAVPDGVSFVAEVTLGADGTAERLRLQPRVVEFERRATWP